MVSNLCLVNIMFIHFALQDNFSERNIVCKKVHTQNTFDTTDWRVHTLGVFFGFADLNPGPNKAVDKSFAGKHTVIS